MMTTESTILRQCCKIIKFLQHFLRAKDQSLWQKIDFHCFYLKCFTSVKAYVTKQQKYNFLIKIPQFDKYLWIRIKIPPLAEIDALGV